MSISFLILHDLRNCKNILKEFLLCGVEPGDGFPDNPHLIMLHRVHTDCFH